MNTIALSFRNDFKSNAEFLSFRLINYEPDLSLSCVECSIDILPGTNYDFEFTKHRKGTSQTHIK